MSAPEVLFYHLERSSLEAALAPMLEKCLERGWRALVRGTNAKRLEMLDAHLWTFRDDAFVPHGLDTAGQPQRQPVLLTLGDALANTPEVVFLVDGASFGEVSGLKRVCVVFDGGDEAAVSLARTQWKEVKAKGLAATYWKQNEQGGWVKQA